jgi:hypothetical protein
LHHCNGRLSSTPEEHTRKIWSTSLKGLLVSSCNVFECPKGLKNWRKPNAGAGLRAFPMPIVVDFSKPIGIEFIDLANDLEKLLNRKVDLISKDGIKPKYFREIQPEIIYV